MVFNLMVCGSRRVSYIGNKTELAMRIAGYYKQHHTNLMVLTGGAMGIDSSAIKFCLANDIPVRVIRPIDYNIKSHYLYRNIELITMADEILAFWDGQSRGTKFVIDYARARNKPIKVIEVRG